jgi:hypothetical protein
VGSAAANAGSSIVQFVSTFGTKMAEAASATIAWITEQTIAAGTFIAENVAEAAAATMAFIAENAASLGLITIIAALVAAILYLATHWKQVWADIEAAALWVWHNVLDPMWQGIAWGAQWVYDHAIMPWWLGLKQIFGWVSDLATWLWHDVFDPLWKKLGDGVGDFITAFKNTWNTLSDVFKVPVNFLINTVYTQGIEALWNDVVNALGQSNLKLPDIKGFAAGGVVPGYAPGQDTVPAMLSPGEGVLVPEAVQALGPGTVLALNAAYGGGRVSTPGHYKGGGIVDTIVGDGKTALKVAEIVAALQIGDISLLTDALVGSIDIKGASGNYQKLLTAIPKQLTQFMAKAVSGGGSSSSSGSGGAGVSTPAGVTGTIAQWFSDAVAATDAPTSWIPSLETIANYESGDNPRAINLWDSNAAAGDPSRGLMQTIMSTFLAYHQPGTSDDIYDPVANIAAGINYIRSRYGDVSNVPGIKSLARGGSYVGYDSGGWLMPGNLPVNGLSRPEAVLTPDQSQWLQAMAQAGAQQGGMPGREVTVVQHFNGVAFPNAEQKAAMHRELALALSGA